jgi:hypothetical protein
LVIGIEMKGIETSFRVVPLFFKSFHFCVISLFEMFSKYLQSLRVNPLGLKNSCGSDNIHLGHPRVTVTCKSDSALFTLGLNLAKSTPLAARRWPITALELPEVNKPQARISGVGDFHSSPIHSHTCIEVTSLSML